MKREEGFYKVIWIGVSQSWQIAYYYAPNDYWYSYGSPHRFSNWDIQTIGEKIELP